MRTDWLVAEIDYICFSTSVAMLLLAAICRRLLRSGGSPLVAWSCLGYFGLFYGGVEWLEMLPLDAASQPVLYVVQSVMVSLAFAALLEFGRRSGRDRASVYWWLLPLAALEILLWQTGLPGMGAACRLALGLPGGIWAAWALWSAAEREAGHRRRAVRGAALALLLGTGAISVVVPRADIWPASWLNQDSFLASSGVPIHGLRAICAWMCLICIWQYRRAVRPASPDEGKFACWMLPAALPVLMVLGWSATAWRGRVVDAEMRQDVLRQAQSLAQAIPLEPVRQLLFTPSDRTNPAFQRLREPLIAYGKYAGLRNIYTMAVRDKRIVFGPENLDENGPLASPPGTVYRQPRPEDWDVFRLGQPVVFGPFTDEYGSFVNGLAPVLDPRSGQVELVVGVDIPSAQWQSRVAAARRTAIGVVLVVISLLVCAAGVLQYRERIPAEQQTWWWKQAETLLTAGMGLALTSILGLAMFDVEWRLQRDEFLTLADAKAEVVRDSVLAIGGKLGSVARFFAGSTEVTPRDFQAFVGPLVRVTPVQTWEWIPLVSAEEKEPFEAQMQRAGFAGFQVTENLPGGERVPATGRPEYFPTAFIEPLSGHESACGFDRGADASQRAALQQAARTGFGTAALSRASAGDPRQRRKLVLFEPVLRDTDPHSSGCVACELCVQTLLQHALAFVVPAGAALNTQVLELTDAGAPAGIAEHPLPPERGNSQPPGVVRDEGLCDVQPLFISGRTWAVVQRPTEMFWSTHRTWLHRPAAAMGLLITLLVTAVVGSLRSRQTTLEERVSERTRELQAEHDLFMGGPTIVFLWRNAAEWPVEYVSGNVQQMLGYEGRQLTEGECGFSSLVHPDEWPEVARSVQAYIAEQAVWFEQEFRLRHASGEYRWFHNFTVLRRDARGAVTHYHGYLQDISERKRAEAGLRRRDAILAAAQFAGEQFLRGQAWEATVPDVLARVGRASGVSRVYVFENHAGPGGRLLTSQRYEWVADGIEPQVDNPDLQGVPCDGEGFVRWATCLERGEAICGLVREMPLAERAALEPQGIISLAAMPIHASGRWWGFIGFDDCRRPYQWRQAELDALRVVADMLGAALERKQAEDSLKASEERFRATVENAPAGIFVEVDGRFAYLNDLGARLLGADSPSQLIGTPVLQRVHADFQPGVRERLRVVDEGRRAVPTEEENWVRLDGALLEAEFSAVPFSYEGRRGGLVFFRDIAGRKRQEEALIRSQKLEALGTFAGGIAHDFNNILSAISGSTDLAVLDLPSDHPVQGNLAEIRKGCVRAIDLVRRILTFSRPHEPTRTIVAFQDVVQEAISLLRPVLPAMIELRTQFAPGLPPVRADATQLHQIVVNLATNAAHAIRGGSGWIEFRLDVAAVSEDLVTAAERLRPGCYVRLAVMDNGCGMNQATLERVFDPFFTTKPHGQGTGLGLSVVHGIAQSHGGGILVDTQPGKGSTFYLYLPAAEVAASQCAPDELAAEQQPVPQVRGARILYVDDEEPLVFLAKRQLQRIGHVVTGHTDAARALREFCSRPGDFDVVVTDLSMPGMSGFEFARRVLAVRPGMPILMTSGYVRPEDQEAARQMGILNLMLKPTTLDDMVVLLDRMVSSAGPFASATPESR